jgi:hypothetical protein
MYAPRFARLRSLSIAIALTCHASLLPWPAQAQANVPLSSLDGSNGFRLTASVAGDGVGEYVWGLGDINGDGIDDMAIGAPGVAGSAGAVYVVYGQAADFPALVDLAALDGSNGFRIDGLAGGDRLGSFVSRVGDLNGDGIQDLVISAPQSDPRGLDRAGTVYVLYVGSFGAAVDLAALDGSNGFRVEGVAQFHQLRGSSAVDINGDGRDDLPLCAHRANSCYVVFGPTGSFGAAFDLATLDGSNGFRIPYTGPGLNSFGWDLTTGDFNGDGVDDLAMGSERSVFSGNAYVLFGRATTPANPTPFAATIDLSLLDGTDGFRFTDEGQGNGLTGYSLANAGDLNGDGIDDLLAGAPLATADGLTRAGRAYVLFGSASGFPALISVADIDGSNGILINGTISDESLGWDVAAGDLNGDGRSDLAIGAVSEQASRPGGVYLFLGRDGGFPAVVDPNDPGILDGILGLRLNGVANGDWVGNSLSMAADINHDGVADLIVGAPTLNGSGVGQTYVFLGDGPPVLPTGAEGSIVLLEDAVNNGRSIAELLPEGVYLDTQPLAGVSIDQNAAVLPDGVWQYRLASDQAWVTVPTSGLSTSNALLLPPEASLRFLPDEPQDFFGVRHGLLLRAWDGAGADAFSFGPGQDIQPRLDGRGLGGFSDDLNLLPVSGNFVPVNDAPSFSAGNPPAQLEDAGLVVVNGWASASAGPPNEASQSLSFVVTSVVNPGLFTVLPSVDPAGNLSFVSAPDANGTALFSVRVEDDGGTANGGVDRSPEQQFLLQVIAVNDAPSFSASNPPAVNQDAGPQTVPAWAGGFVPGPADEASQAVEAYLVSDVSNPTLFSSLPAVSTDGTLSYTPAPGASGTSTFSVRVRDDGGTSGGGINTSAPQVFTITVTGEAIFCDGFESGGCP